MLDVVIRTAEMRDLPTVELLAKKIWPATYGPMLTAEQIRFMLEKMYGQTVLRQQMTESEHQFLILEYHGEPAGYASFSPLTGEKKTKLHKFYLDPALHGKGLGRIFMEQVIRRVKANGSSMLQLDVNRLNPAKDFYRKMGFSILKEKDTPIGNGFFMNDYVMERAL
jgi:GNAT superfamily N-acetyltransferase